MVDAMLELMPTAEVWHLGLFRDERTLRPVEYYNKLPDSATVDLCLILDPDAGHRRLGHGRDRGAQALGRRTRIKLINLIAAPEGVRAVAEAHPDVAIFTPRPSTGSSTSGLHHARPGRRRRPPVRHRQERLSAVRTLKPP